MSNQQVQLKFQGVSDKDANLLAASLLEALRDVGPDVNVQRERARADTQDMGATLVLILGTAAVQALAKGISVWIARNSGVKLEIVRDGATRVVASNLDSGDAARIAEALS